MKNNRMNGIVSLAGMFLLGGLIGAGVAMLTAPKSGPETRNLIRDKSMELRNRAMNTAEETKQRANQALDDISSQTKEKVSSLRHRGEDMVHEQKERLQDRTSGHM